MWAGTARAARTGRGGRRGSRAARGFQLRGGGVCGKFRAMGQNLTRDRREARL